MTLSPLVPHRSRTPQGGRRVLAVAVAGLFALAGAVAGVGCGEEPADDATGPGLSPTDGAAGPRPTTGTAPSFEPGTTVRLVTHDSFDVTEDVLASFEEQTGLEVEIIRGGDAVSMVNQAILTAGDPQGDVLFGIDDNLLAAAFDAELFVPYEPAALDHLDPDLDVDDQHRVTPVDRGDVCVNYDVAGLAERGLEPPASLSDLADEAYAGLLAVENPATSTPGLAFLAATVAADAAGDLPGGWQAYWEALVANDVVVSDGWEEAYYGEFSGGSGEGNRPLVVSYASSPPAEVVFSEPYASSGELPGSAPTGVVEGTCVRQVEYAGVLRGTPQPEAAAALVEFLLSEELQADIPLTMFVWPARTDVELPEVYSRFATRPADPYTVDPERVAAERDEWVDVWTDLLLG